jgi:apolipoprotein N-acyltransferase
MPKPRRGLIGRNPILRLPLRLVAAVLGGILAGMALPKVDYWPAILASVVLVHLAVQGLGFWRGFVIGLPAGIAFYAAQSVWMSAYLGPEPWLALSVLEGIIMGLGLGLAASIWSLLTRHKEQLRAWYFVLASLWLPLIWVAREWVACHFPYGGYQWSRLGQAVANNQLAYLAYWGGISLVSLAVAVLGVGLLLAWEVLISDRSRGLEPGKLMAALAPMLVLVLLAVLTPAAWKAQAPAKHTLRVVAIQGNANAGLFANPDPGSILAKHLTVTEDYLAANPRNNFDLMVWPENSADVNPLTNPIAANLVRSVVARTGKPLLVGSITQSGSDIYNSGLLFTPGTDAVTIYDKRRPVPFGEYVPDRGVWRQFAPSLIDLISRGYSFGQRPGVMAAAGTSIGDLICFEIGIDEIPHDLVTGGASVIISQANNADFGHTAEAFQQEALVRLQAIATGRAVVHASTVATTEIVAPTGKVLAGTQPFRRDWAVATVPLETGLTPAMRFFGWVDYLALIAAALAAIVLLGRIVPRLTSGKSQPENLEFSEVDRKAALKTLVIMPTYNEAQNIGNIAGHLLATVSEVDLLIVDDNSPDGTGDIADAMAAENPRVHVLHRTEKNGLGPAYLAGFAWGFEQGYEYLVEMDADGSHRAEDLINMLAVAPNNDLVIGSRWVRGGKVVNWPVSRQLISRTGNLYARIMLGAGIRDITAGFRVFRASFLQSLDLQSIASAGYSFQVEMAWRCFKAKARIQEVPITFVERAIGYSKMSNKIVFEALWRVTQWGFERF